MLKKTLLASAAALLIGFAPAAVSQDAQAQTDPNIKIAGAKPKGEAKEITKADNAHRTPSISISGTNAGTGGDDDGQGDVDDDTPPPPPESDTAPEAEDQPIPEFFGEPISGKFVWGIDRSGSMGASDSGSGPIEGPDGGIITSPSRMQIVKSEANKALNGVTEEDEFAILSFGNNPEQRFYQALVPGTPGNVDAARNEINGLNPYGWTPAYSCLRNCCTQYGTELDKIYFLCDGSPNYDAGAPNNNGNASVILAEFPNWFQGLQANGCQLVCIHIGSSGAAQQFMQALAALGNGIYIHK